MPTDIQSLAFPTLSSEEIEALRPFGSSVDFPDNAPVFRAGQSTLDLFIVESGHIEIQNPTDNHRVVATHNPGAFSGDIDLLTQRPPLVSGIARGPTRLLRIPSTKLREILNHIPRFGEKLMNAFTARRQLLIETDAVGLRIIGPGYCKDTATVREFLYKNFVPFKWFDPATPEGRALFLKLGSPKKTPIVLYGDDTVLLNPSLQELARTAGIWRLCPNQDADFAIIGAGPAGIAAAVYAASEGLNTLVLDRLGPGGQVSGSSRIENFIGFPAGLSGADLATRGVLQMLKFGAGMIAPINVERLEPAATPGAPHLLHLDCGATVHASTVLVATGVRWRKLEATDAERYEGAGIYYVCTSVEAILFDKSDVAVVGAGNSAGQAAMYLAECCPERRVHMIIRGELGPGMSEYLVARIRGTRNITVRDGTEISAVQGDRRLQSVQLRNRTTRETSTLPCAAVFVFIGSDPLTTFLPDSIGKDQLGFLLTGTDTLRSGLWPLKDRDPCPLETTIPGLLAAGDIRAGSTKRVGFAVGDGSLAVTCAHRLRALRA